MTVITKSYNAPPVNQKEIFRYAGVKKETPELSKMLDDCLASALGKISYKLCFCLIPVKTSENTVELGSTRVVSKDLSKNLGECNSAVVFAATLGQELDRTIARFSAISPSKAVMLQAIGSERIEALCNIFNAEIRKEYGSTAPRFSPGYGDLPLELQCDIFSLLDCSRKIGLTLCDSLLMSPSKSVTAIIGIKNQEKL